MKVIGKTEKKMDLEHLILRLFSLRINTKEIFSTINEKEKAFFTVKVGKLYTMDNGTILNTMDMVFFTITPSIIVLNLKVIGKMVYLQLVKVLNILHVEENYMLKISQIKHGMEKEPNTI